MRLVLSLLFMLSVGAFAGPEDDADKSPAPDTSSTALVVAGQQELGKVLVRIQESLPSIQGSFSMAPPAEEWKTRPVEFIKYRRWIFKRAFQQNRDAITAEIGFAGFGFIEGFCDSVLAVEEQGEPWKYVFQQLQKQAPQANTRRDYIQAYRIFVSVLLAELAKTEVGTTYASEIGVVSQVGNLFRLDPTRLVHSANERWGKATNASDYLKPSVEVLALLAYYPTTKPENVDKIVEDSIAMAGKKFGVGPVEAIGTSLQLVLQHVAPSNAVFTGKTVRFAFKRLLQEMKKHPSEGAVRLLASLIQNSDWATLEKNTDSACAESSRLLIVATIREMLSEHQDLLPAVLDIPEWVTLLQIDDLFTSCVVQIGDALKAIQGGTGV